MVRQIGGGGNQHLAEMSRNYYVKKQFTEMPI